MEIFDTQFLCSWPHEKRLLFLAITEVYMFCFYIVITDGNRKILGVLFYICVHGHMGVPFLFKPKKNC